jgi:hypothetical protein
MVFASCLYSFECECCAWCFLIKGMKRFLELGDFMIEIQQFKLGALQKAK